MAHKSGFLSGPEPEEVEEKTAAQLDDDRQTESMRASRSMYRLAEDDSTPAIEQQIAKQEIIQADKTKPKIEVNQNFEAEMAARHEKEKQLKAERDEKAEREKASREAAEKQELAQKLAQTQEIDPEKIKEQRAEANFKANLQKIYPDRLEQYDKVDDALWQKRANQEHPLPERAKLVDKFNDELHTRLIISGVLQGVTLLILLIAIFSSSMALKFFLTIISVAILVAAIIFMHQGGKKCNHNIVPSEQRFAFTALSVFPTMAIRIILALPLLFYGSMFGQIACMAVSGLVGATIQFDLLNRYHVPTNMYLVILNTFIFNAVAFVILLSGDPFGIVTFVIGFPIYFSVEHLAYKLALRPN